MRTLFTGIIPDSIEALQTRYGADILCTPLIEIAPVDDDAPLRAAIARLASYRYLLFTSRHAVAAVIPLVPSSVAASSVVTQYTAAVPQSPALVSIGPATTAALRKAGFSDVAEPERDNSYGVVSWFARQQRGRVLIPRSSLALDIIPDGLRRLGFEVDTVTAYVNRMPANPRKADLDGIDRIVFTAPSTIDNFISLYGALPEGKEFVTRGLVTAQHLQTIIKQQRL